MSEDNKKEANASGKNNARIPRRTLPQRPGFPPPPPHGFPGGFPPPPPPGFRGFPPPPPYGYNPHEEEYEEYEEIEYVEEDELVDSSDEDSSEEDIQSNYNVQQTQPEETPKGRDLMADGGDVSLLHIQQQGKVRAGELEHAEKISGRWSVLLKIVLSISLTVLIIGGLVYFVSTFVSTYTVDEKTEAFADEIAWQLPDNTENIVVKKFYRTMGGIDKMSKVKNKLLRGKISIENGPLTPFYCIEKGAQAYICIDGQDSGKFYFIGANGKGKRLHTTSYLGKFDPLKASEAETLVNAVLFDELLNNAAFDQAASARQPFTSIGSKRIGENLYEAVTIKTGEGLSDIFCFDIVNNRLAYRLIERNGINVRVEYSDFKEFQNGYIYPATRKVFIDDILAVRAIVENIAINKDVMFPR